MIELQDWADQMVLDLNTYGNMPQLDEPENWQDWAVSLCAIAGITSKNPPDPRAYTDWKEWASRFAQVMT